MSNRTLVVLFKIGQDNFRFVVGPSDVVGKVEKQAYDALGALHWVSTNCGVDQHILFGRAMRHFMNGGDKEGTPDGRLWTIDIGSVK